MKEKELEDTLANPVTYSDAKRAKELNIEFNSVKEELSEKLREWEKLTEELINIEAKFG